MITWKQRGSRILGAYVAGFGTGLGVTIPDFTGFTTLLFHASLGGLIMTCPQIKMVLEEYARKRN